MNTEVISYFDYLLLLPYLFIFFLIARRYAKKHSETPGEFYWLLINWWIKMIAGILYAWMIVYYYGYGDPIGYKDRSDALFDNIFKNWENIKYIFMPAESFKEYLSGLGYSNMPYTSDLGYYNEPVFMVSRISCIASFFTFNRFLIISILFTNIGYYGFMLIYTTSKKIIQGYNKLLIISCLFIPSCIFWSSGLAKEPVCIFALGIIFSCAFKLFFEKKIRLKSIIALLFFSYLLFTVKSYIFLCFSFAFIVWMFYNRIQQIFSRSIIIKITFFMLFILMAAGITYFFANSLVNLVTENLKDIITSNIDVYENMAASRQRGSLIEVSDRDFSSVGGILKFIPQGLVNVFFRPFPWEIDNILMIFTALENTIFIFLLVIVIFKSRFFTKNLFINKNYQVLAILFTITLALAIGISTFNLGTMARYKMPFLPFWVGFLLIMIKKLADNKRVVSV